MARIRTVKPDFWKDEELSSINPEAALLAIGLLNHSDDEGYFKANPKLIEAEIFPLRELSVSIHELIKELSNVGYIKLFKGEDGKQYGAVTNFTEHQRINRPTPSKINSLELVIDDSLSNHGGLTIGKERKGREEEGKGKERQVAVDVRAVFDYWVVIMSKGSNTKLTPTRKTCIKARLADGYSLEFIKQAIDGCAGSPHHMGKNDAGTVYDDLTLICRTGDKLESFAKNIQAGKKADAQAIEAWLDETDQGGIIEGECHAG